jgi:hypothetical protein
MACAAAPADADSTAYGPLTGSSQRQTQIPVAVSGDVQLDFHGDPAAGCAAAGVCEVAGRHVWDPGQGGQMIVSQLSSGRRDRYLVFLALLGLDGPRKEPRTSTQTRRGAGVCADSASGIEFSATTSVTLGPGPVRLSLPATDAGNPFATRCGGPLAADVARLLPALTARPGTLRRGRRTFRLASERPFAAHGFAGTLRSSLVLRLGRPRAQPGGGAVPPDRGAPRVREISVVYAVERLGGQVIVPFAGLGDPAGCGFLDACGVSGRITVTPRATGGALVLSAMARATRSRRELRAAVGLAPGGRRPGIRVFAGGEWSGLGGVTAALSRPGGFCRDSVPLRSGSLAVTVSGTRATVMLPGDTVLPDPLRTRCPGPALEDLARSEVIARQALPLRAFGARRVVLHLRRGARIAGSGYSGRTEPDVTVVLRRVGIEEEVRLDPFG